MGVNIVLWLCLFASLSLFMEKSQSYDVVYERALSLIMIDKQIECTDILI